MASAQKNIRTTQNIVVIDPGHGGKNTGLVTSTGTQEKEITLQLALKVANQLSKQYNIFLTRTKHTDLDAKERSFFAKHHDADLYISIHLHSSTPSLAFAYYFAPDGSDVFPENSWRGLPIKHQTASKKAAAWFANNFKANKTRGNCILKGITSPILEGTQMPSILIEPLSIKEIAEKPENLNATLEHYSFIISKSIDDFFKHSR